MLDDTEGGDRRAKMKETSHQMHEPGDYNCRYNLERKEKGRSMAPTDRPYGGRGVEGEDGPYNTFPSQGDPPTPVRPSLAAKKIQLSIP